MRVPWSIPTQARWGVAYKRILRTAASACLRCPYPRRPISAAGSTTTLAATMSDTTATGTDFDVLSLASSFPGDLSEPVSPKLGGPQRRPSLRQRLEQDRLFYRAPLEAGAAVLRLERIWNNLCSLWLLGQGVDVQTQLEKLEMLEELLELVVLMRVQGVRTCLHEFYANATTIIKCAYLAP